MDEDNDDENSLSGLSEKSDSEIVKECEIQLQEIMNRENMETEMQYSVVEKRRREDSEENSEDGFTTVIRRRPKRLLRSDSLIQSQNNTDMRTKTGKEESQGGYEVYLTSLTALPKQFAMAKLLKQENIDNVLKIRHKNPYKVLIQFGTKEQAKKLINCYKLQELGYRCQPSLEVSLSYGIIKGVELDLNIEEISKTLECDYEITSVIRLNRLNYEGKWVESETVRVCFKNSTVPPYVYAYGCRLKVEPYEFPVTQCSMCWKFGHAAKFCPIKKHFCPKCGKDHQNCETLLFKCINCRGSHMALDKSCPIFIKEKRIRSIMCNQNTTYRKAVQIYVEGQSSQNKTEDRTIPSQYTSLHNTISSKKLYSAVLTTEALVHQDTSSTNTNDVYQEDQETVLTNIFNKNKKKKKSIFHHITDKHELDNKNSDNKEEKTEGEKEDNRRRFDWRQSFKRVKEILTSEKSWEEKVLYIFKLIFEEFKILLYKCISKGDTMDFIFNFFNG
jgi:hypothetical protein